MRRNDTIKPMTRNGECHKFNIGNLEKFCRLNERSSVEMDKGEKITVNIFRMFVEMVPTQLKILNSISSLPGKKSSLTSRIEKKFDPSRKTRIMIDEKMIAKPLKICAHAKSSTNSLFGNLNQANKVCFARKYPSRPIKKNLPIA